MEHVVYYINDGIKELLKEHQEFQTYFKGIGYNDFRRNIYHEIFSPEDIKYIKIKQNELRTLLCVCKHNASLLDIHMF
jgi:hypothetical protein